MIPIGTNVRRNKFPTATIALICANVIVFILELLLSDDSLTWVVLNFGFGPATRNPLALITHMFLHGDIYHIAFNMLFLWIFGSPVEERTGSKNFLIYYFGGGIAAGLLNTVVEILVRPDSTVPCIGASGAISGIMALFLYRCFYSKLKLVISPILLPRQINIPVVPLVLFWFFQDVIMGILSISQPTGIGHWAHIGGFIFGIVIGRIKRYGHEGRVEQLRERILKKLEEGGGWKTAEKDLLKLLDIAPDDPEVHHDLARLYADSNQQKLSERHFKISVQLYFLTDPLSAAYTLIEYIEKYAKPLGMQYHLKAAEALSGRGEYEDAYKTIAPFFKYSLNKSPLLERGLVLSIKLCQHLDKKQEAFEAIKIFMDNFPGSKYKIEIKEVLNSKPGEVFPPIKPVAQVSTPTEIAQEQKDAARLSTIESFEMFFADPVFWSILLFVNIAAPILFPGLYFSSLSPVFLFAGAFVMTVVHRMGSISDIFSHISGPSEKKVRKEVWMTQTFDEAHMAERKGNFPGAASLYEQLLLSDPKNIQTRFNLARVYEKKLDDNIKARLHYQELLKHVPEGHPYHREATEFLAETGIDI